MRRILAGLFAVFRPRPGNRFGPLLSIIGAAVATVLLLIIFLVSNQVKADRQVADARTPRAAETVSTQPRTIAYIGYDQFEDRKIYTVRIVNGDISSHLTPPGIPRLPNLGEAFFSPALADLLAEHRKYSIDPAVLLDRFPETNIKNIDPLGLTTPRELVAYIGVANPATQTGAPLVGWGGSNVALLDKFHRVGVVVVILSLTLPIALLSVLSGLANTSARRRRLETLRALGYSTRDLQFVVCLEISVLSAIGMLVGETVFLLGLNIFHNSSWLPWAWWPAAVVPKLFQLSWTAVLMLLLPTVVGTVLTRQNRQALMLGSGRLVRVRHRVALYRFAPLVVASLLIIFMTKLANNSGSLIPAIVILCVCLISVINPINYWWSQFSVERSRSFEWFYSARSSQQTPAAALRASGALSVAVFLAVTATLVVQHFALEKSIEERASNASWPIGTVEADQSLHGDDVTRMTAISGVHSPWPVRILQGPTAGGSFVTVAIVKCATLVNYVGPAEFPLCGKGGALNIESANLLGDAGPQVVDSVAKGVQAFTASHVSDGKLTTFGVKLNATSVARSARLTSMFGTIGISLMIGENNLPAQYVSKTLVPYFFFRTTGADDSVDRVRTYFANKYGNSSVVQTLQQRLDATQSDAGAFASALSLCTAFSILMGLFGFCVTFVGELRGHRAVSSALMAIGVPPGTIFRSSVLSSMFTILPAIGLGGLSGLLVGHSLIASDHDVGTPVFRVLEICSVTLVGSFTLIAFITTVFGPRRIVSPSIIASE